MSINQDFISRLTVDTVSDAEKLTLRENELVTINETNLLYKTITNSGDIPLDNGLYLEPIEHALRGKSDYPQYVFGQFYAVGDKVYNTGSYYRCIQAVSSSSPFNADFWQELSVEHGFEILDEEREFQKATESSFEQTIQVVGELDKLSDGATLTEIRTNAILSSLAIGATVRTNFDRALPSYHFEDGRYGISHTGVNNPTNPSSMVEFIIPEAFVHRGSSLTFIKKNNVTDGEIFVYSGDPLSGGFRLSPHLGFETTDENASYVNYVIADSSRDVHVLFYNSTILEIRNTPYVPSLNHSEHLSEGIRGLSLISGYVNGDRLTEGDAAALLKPFGVNASFKLTNNRVTPLYADIWGYGFTGGTVATPTIEGDAVEIVIPAANLDPNNEVVIQRSSTGGLGNHYIRAYSGDPISGGTEIPPRTGSNEYTSTDSAVISFIVGSGNINIPEDIHIVFVGQYVKDINIRTYLPQEDFDTTQVDAIRGSVAYNTYQETGTSYAIGDKVFEPNTKLNYKALVAISDPAGIFNPLSWRELSVEALDEASSTTQIDAVRGNPQYDTYQVTGTAYVIGDKVFEPTTSKNYRAIEAISNPAGAFNPLLWQELSVEELDKELSDSTTKKIEQLAALRGSDEYPLYDTNASYSVGDKVFYNKRNYTCIVEVTAPAGNFDPTDWRELSVENNNEELLTYSSSIEELRGSEPYDTYQETGVSYAVNDKVYVVSTNRNYECITAITAPAGEFNPSNWREISVDSNANPENIRDRLSELAGTERLDSSAIKNLPNTSSGLLASVQRVADSEGLSSGDLFSEEGANDFIKAFGVPAFFSTSGSRVLPKYFNSNNRVGFGTDAGGTDPSNPNDNYLEIVIPTEYFSTSQELRITSVKFSDSGERSILAYNGDATSGGTELILTRGRSSNTADNPHTRFWNIPVGGNDIHIYISQQTIVDIALPNKAVHWGIATVNANTPTSAYFLKSQTDYVHGTRLELGDANSMLSHLGVSALWRTTNSRVLPQFMDNTDNGLGFYTGGLNLDPTGDAEVCEFVISKAHINQNMRLKVVHATSTGNAGARDVTVWHGDPTSGGEKLSPIFGQESNTTQTREITEWQLSSDVPDLNSPTEDIHVVFRAQTVNAIKLYDNDILLSQEEDIIELRGGERPADWTQSEAYNETDEVFYSGFTYVANTNIPANTPWNPDSWDEATVVANAKRLTTVQDELVHATDGRTVLRGHDGAYADYQETGVTYNIGDIVHELTTGRDQRAKELIPAPAGVFDITKWDEVSVQANNKPESVRDRLQELSEDSRLDVHSVKFPSDAQVVYVSNTGGDAFGGRTPSEAKATIGAALTLATSLPDTTRRTIVCIDSSSFTEDISVSESLDLYMPMATVTGTIQSATTEEVNITIGKQVGVVNLIDYDHFTFGDVTGNLTVGDCSTNGASLTANNWYSGTANTLNALGYVVYDIHLNTAGLVLFSPNPDYNPRGIVRGDHVDPFNERDALQSLIGDSRLSASAIKDLPRGTYSEIVNQTLHGFSEGNLLNIDSSGTFIEADRTTPVTALGAVSRVIDADTFELVTEGAVNAPSHGLAVSEYYWLGQNGGFLRDQPTTGVIQKVLFIRDANTILVDIGQAYRKS